MPSSKPSMIVLDAGVAVWTLAPGPTDTSRLFEQWAEQALWAPEIWLPEVISVLRGLEFAGMLTRSETEQAIADAFLLDVQVFPTDETLALASLAWARRLQQRRAYDGLYVALAERLNAPLWTTDRRLVHSLQKLGVAWAHWVGESLAD